MRAIGFTGTRKGFTEAQREGLRLLMAWLTDTGGSLPLPGVPQVVGHHGQAEGADEAFWLICRELGWGIEMWPALHTTAETGLIVHPKEVLHLPDEPLRRNRKIVDVTEALIACPASRREEQRSGTWATVRYARSKRRPIYMVWPDGEGGLEVRRG